MGERKYCERSKTLVDETERLKCNCEPLEEINCQYPNIGNTDCIGIIAERIYDNVYLKTLQFADKEEVFKIDNCMKSSYCPGDVVRINEVSVCYDCIGAMDDDAYAEDDVDKLGKGRIIIKYDMEEKILCGVKDSACYSDYYPDGFTKCDECIERESICKNRILYSEFEGTVVKSTCSDEENEEKVRMFMQGVRFYADNLRVRIKGFIGDKPFSATKDYMDYGQDEAKIKVNPVEITKKDTLGNGECVGADVGLNFNPINLYAVVKLPIESIVGVNLSFDTCLSAEFAETNERYGDSGIGEIRAIVGYSFMVTSNIRHTINEELAVFTNPKGLVSRETHRDSKCIKKTF